MKRLLAKLRSLPRTYYIIGIPLLCGVIIGTVVTLSIPKVKADLTVTDQGSTSNQSIDTSASKPANVITQPPQPTTVQDTPTTAPNAPTATQTQQVGTTSPTATPAPCK